MKSYYRINIRSMQNGYMLEAAYKVADKEGWDGTRTREDEFVFTSWDEVENFIKNNVLEVPPKDPQAKK